jgi:hypothetical protein
MTRPDVSDKLVHFTSGVSEEAAFGNLCSIIEDGAIRSSAGKIKGGYRCVCFTEAPLATLRRGLVNLSGFSKYQPFGVIYDKAHVYVQGGRPAIYQSDEEFFSLSETHRWRHMRYEPIVIPPAEHPTDFTWEREWRIQCESFEAPPHLAALVLPTHAWANRLLEAHNEQQDHHVYEYSQIMDMHLAEQYRELFPWRLCVLEGGI